MMIRIGRILLLAIATAGTIASAGSEQPSALRAVNLRCEYKTDPLGIDEPKPRFSWQLENGERGVLQASYEVRVALSEAALKEGKQLWDSGILNSDQSIQVEYHGPQLESAHAYFWQVRVSDNHGHTSDWSQIAHWEMGLLNDTDWKAKWITPDLIEDETKSNPSPLLRKEFSLQGDVVRARLYATAMGLYELELNGKRVGDQYFTPGWTAYDFRYQYQTYDVTALVRNGENCLAAMLGDGWFRGRLGWEAKRNIYGKKLALLAQLVITYSDGTSAIVGTDDGWKSSTGPILMSDLYDGETYDARLDKPGWDQPGFSDQKWRNVHVLPAPKARLVAPAGPAVKAIEEIKPVKVLKTPAGETVLDMGQNMVGWIRFRVRAHRGSTITLKHAEVLDKSGNLYTQNLRSAQETIRYIASGSGTETYQPHFSFQGFRYVAVSGWPGKLSLDDFTGVVVHSDMRRTGNFESSSSLLNQLQHNIVWGQKGNFLDIPTDCPQRDERLGWTGDAEVFAPTASFNHDTAAFFTKWLKDVALDQEDDGAVPYVIPNEQSRDTRTGSAAAAGWSDVALVVPWTVYQAYGDTRVLSNQYQSMKAWVEYMRREAGETYLWKSGYSFGDWLAFATTDSDYPGATTDKDLIQTTYFARSTALLARTAEILGKQQDAKEYSELEDKIKAAFGKEFVTPNGRLSSNTQTAYSLALEFDLLPSPMRQQAASRLAADVTNFGHLTTGFLGTPLISKALSDYGYLDEAYMLLNRTEYPSWLYPVTQGATTIWERWDGIKPDGTFQSPKMNSFNHYAYGAIGDWMYTVVAGIAIDETRPGYKHVLIEPQPGGKLKFAGASIQSMYGEVASRWELAGSKMTLTVTIPPNTTATVRLPDSLLKNLKESGDPIDRCKACTDVHQVAKAVTMEIGSGHYQFETTLENGKTK